MSAIQQLATQAQEYQGLYESGQLAPDEFKQLVEDLKTIAEIEMQAEQLESDIMYRAVLLGVIQIASALA